MINFSLALASAVTEPDPFDKVVTAVCATINCDAVALMRAEHATLTPVAQRGLSADMMGRRFELTEHPRLKAICDSRAVVCFAADSPLPDPYDGMILGHEHDITVHSCMGMALYKEKQLLGVLTLDSVEPHQFDAIDYPALNIIASLIADLLYTKSQLERLEHKSLHAQHVLQAMSEQVSDVHHNTEMIGKSKAMQSLRKAIRLAAPSDLAILIEGESGVGKELVARELHFQSARKQQPLVYVNCAAIARHLIESELFGHVKGAFTSAVRDREGKFLLADGGTLFLDEIGELPLEVQGTLLRAIQNQEIQVVGKDIPRKVNVRIIAATNRSLDDEVNAGRFRNDLYHRLSAFPIPVPPLTQRTSDIPLLAGFFAETVRRKLGLQQLTLSQATMQYLTHYSWPGNIRELEHVISRAALYAKEETSNGITTITPEHLTGLSAPMATHDNTRASASQQQNTLQLRSGESSSALLSDMPVDLRERTAKFQSDLIYQALQLSQGSWTKAATMLSMDRANLARLAKRLGVTVEKSVTR